tara:strand:+ start:2937 stop:3710 length:774 start_codon:yes stop_codon:yes gene_type:complete
MMTTHNAAGKIRVDKDKGAGLSDIDGIPLRIVTHPQAKRLRLRYDYARQQAILTLPPGVTTAQAQPFLDQYHHWLHEQHSSMPQPTPFLPGARIPLGGTPHQLHHHPDRPARLILEEPCIQVGGPITGFEKRVENGLKRLCRTRIEALVSRMAMTLNVQHGRITLRDTHSRWGSCSAKGHLSFSWRIIMAPPQVMEYLVAHEVSHLKELNHSKAFWGHVDHLIDHRQASRKWLKTHGHGLFTYGVPITKPGLLSPKF